MSFRSKIRYLYRWDLIPPKVIDKFIQYRRASVDVSYWKELKNKYNGQACFVVGNGPSLKIDDLTKIKENKFISLGSNKVYLAFNETNWRPDFYTVADTLLWDKIKDKIHTDIDTVHIASTLNNQGCRQKTRYWKTLSNSYKVSTSNVKSDITKGMNTGSTITYENIQIAMYLGLNPIYLIGCDHYYKGEEETINGIPIKQSEEKTHFIKGYREPGEIVHAAAIWKMTTAYKSVKKYADKNNIKILNATRGGHLEVFDRIDLDDILNVRKDK